MKWEPVDIVVLILACLIVFSVVYGQIHPLLTENTLVGDTAKFIKESDGAILAIVSMYVGSKIGMGMKKDDDS